MSAKMNVPELRFKEFSGEWEEKLVIDFAPLQRGFDLPVSTIKKGEFPVVFSNGILKYHNEYKAIAPGVVTGRSGTIGNVTYVEDNYWPHNTALWVTDFKNNIPKFVYYFYVRFDLAKFGTGSGVPTLNRNDVHRQKILVPYSRDEQEKIASFLSSVDTKIEQLSKKKTLLGQYKKGVMQKIFSQEIRFRDDDGGEYPEWIERKLGGVSTITTGSSNREDSTQNDGEYTFFDRSEDIRTSSIFLFDGEAVIVAGEGQRFIPKYFVGKFDLHQRTYAIMQFKETIGKFIYYLIYQNQNYFLSQAVGSTVKSLRLPMFQKMIVNLPSLEEQTKIANFLTSLDTKISQIGQQLEGAKQFKKGLLQQMFI